MDVLDTIVQGELNCNDGLKPKPLSMTPEAVRSRARRAKPKPQIVYGDDGCEELAPKTKPRKSKKKAVKKSKAKAKSYLDIRPKAKPKAKPKRKVKAGAVVRSERLDMRLTKAEKAKINARAKKTRRTVTSLVIEAIEKIK